MNKIICKQKIKKIFDLFVYISSLITFPILLFCILLYKIKFFNYKTLTIILSFIPGKLGNYVRKTFYKLTLKKLGSDFRIDFGSYIVYPDVEIGDRVTIEEYCTISKCKIGNDVIFAAKVSTLSGKNHHYVDDLSKTFYNSGGEIKKIELENNLWIGTHAVILEDVASGTVIGAGAVVTKKFEENSIIAGVPARLIRKRGRSDEE